MEEKNTVTENSYETEAKNVKRASKLKRNVTIVVVVLCICAAVYLNLTYNNQDRDSVLTDASLAGAKTGEEMLATSGESDYVSEYFAQARLTRQQSRAEALSLLETAAASASASAETIDSAMNSIAAMATYSMQETQIENLLLAKDFADCVVFMSAEGVTVAVPAPETGLTAEQAARITDAILSETSYNATQIRIIEVKKPLSTPEVSPDDTMDQGDTGTGESVTDSSTDIASQGGYLEGENYVFE